jgi:alpha-tubulin suppressor-like RCC1 family protein
MVATTLRARRSGQAGQEMLEYALILSLIACILVGIVQKVGDNTACVFTQASNGLAGASGGCSVSAWGGNSQGQIGIGTTALAQSTPVQVQQLTSVADVSAGLYFSLAVTPDGQVWAWGDNSAGQLGTGGGNPDVPQPVAGLNGIKQVSGGQASNPLALRSDGTVWTWGDNTQGELGNNTSGAGPNPTPVEVLAGACGPSPCSGPYLNGVTEVASGYFFDLALRSDGTVWSWGNGGNGQLGNGLGATSLAPVEVTYGGSPLTGITSISAGTYGAFALRGDGTVWAWGQGTAGELGNGGTANSLEAVQVSNLTGVTAVGATAWSGVALTSDGVVYTWGSNEDGELGNGTPACATDPCQGSLVPVTASISGVVAIAAGSDHIAALKPDGTVWSWGTNEDGQMGIGTATGPDNCWNAIVRCYTSPVQAAITGVDAISAGGGDTLVANRSPSQG